MRTIKFRGFWKTVKEEWRFAIGNLSIVDNKEQSGYFISNKYGLPFAYEVRLETIGQFTGLYDKNGKEIYEGDIYSYDGGHIDIVEHTIQKDGWSGFKLYSSAGFIYPDIEVIGNIYENPELLK